MKENRLLLISLLVTALVIAIVCFLSPLISDFYDDSIATNESWHEETQKNTPESVTTVLHETVEEETEPETYVYTGTAMPSDWYADIPSDPTSIDKIYIYTVEAYIAVSQAARRGDMEALSACWESTYWNHDFEKDESFLEFMRCIFGRADSALLVWPDDQWELTTIDIRPELDAMYIWYKSCHDSQVDIQVVYYFGGRHSLVKDFIREITVDGVSFSVHDSRSFEFSMHAIHEHGSDIVSFLFNDNVSDDTFATWQYCTIYEYVEK